MEFDYSILHPEQFRGILPSLGFAQTLSYYTGLEYWKHPKSRVANLSTARVPVETDSKQYAEGVEICVNEVTLITGLPRLEILKKLLCYPIPDPELGKRAICTRALTVSVCGFRYMIPAWVVCQDRDRNYKEDAEDTWGYVLSDQLDKWEVIDWAMNNMDWKDVKPYSLLIERPGDPTDRDIQEVWCEDADDGGLDWLPESE